jgi:hypothetical protein
MAFLAPLLGSILPSLGSLLPGIVSTVGKVVGKLGSGDFSGALGEVGSAISGALGSGGSVSNAVAQGASKLEEQHKRDEMEREDERKFERDLARKRRLAEFEYETSARRRHQANNRVSAADMLPLWRGRGKPTYDQSRVGITYEGPKSEPQHGISSGEPIEEVYEEEIPLPKRQKRRRRRGY